MPESGIPPVHVNIPSLARALSIGRIAIIRAHSPGGIHDFPDGTEVVSRVIKLVVALDHTLAEVAFGDGEVGL